MTKGEYRLELLKQRIEIWKTIVDTQQHFNTLQVQLRNFSLTLLTAVFTVIGFAIKEPLQNVSPLRAWLFWRLSIAWIGDIISY
jgi:hypothetical protein